MYLIIIGAGRLGSRLAALASQDGHNVAVVEQEEKRAQEISEKYDLLVIHADVAQGGILEEAGVEKADALVATTNDDSDNLMAMFLGKEHEVKTLISVVNDKKHEKLFQRLGVHVLVDPEMIVSQHLYNVLREPDMEDVVTLPGGGHVFELVLANTSPLAGKTLAEAGREGLVPETLLIVSQKKGKEMLIPTEETSLAAGDHLTVFSLQPLNEEQLKVFTG